ncbi:leucine-rich repeat domain-containing protein [Flavobacterium sp.]|uniref:leucine-rich repeat domain-containing protein n=1 Tax=Flavobacterium sp. TaxID=239 RepID=UPI0031D72F79
MNSEYNIRINTILRELNLSLEKAISILREYGFDIKADPTTKISGLEVSILKKHFSNSEKKPKNIYIIEYLLNIEIRNIENSEEALNFYTLNSRGEVITLKIKVPDSTYDEISYDGRIKLQYEFFSIISKFSKLESLVLSDNDFDSYSMLKNLKNLKYLELKNNELEDISFLASMSSLIHLNLSSNKIYGIGALSDLINLQELYLNDNQIVNINPLKNLTSLRMLDLSNNRIRNINTLRYFKSFQFLHLDNNQITDVSALSNIYIEEELFLSQNDIKDLTPLYFSFLEFKINFINVYDNPLKYPPMEVAIRGEREIASWFIQTLEVARGKIKANKYTLEKTLDLSGCGITDLSLLNELFDDTEHIEELILSNEYAKIDEDGNWDSNANVGYYPNNIIGIPSQIKKLKKLKILYIGGDWNKGNFDTWNRWRIKSIQNLLHLKELEVLNISNNMIESLNGIEKLPNLRSLYANNNKIKNINYLDQFKSLQELYLSNNEISNLEFMRDLKGLKTVDLHSNKIKNLKPIIHQIHNLELTYTRWNINCINIADNPLDQTLKNIFQIIEKSDRDLELYNYFERLLQGDSTAVKRIKLILLGNTQAGKTTFADIISNSKKANGDSTHGVNFFNFKVKDIEVSGYDFGGQDYYHNTHHSFFDEKSLYMVIWGNGQENILRQNENEEILFPINYWLGSLNTYSRKFNLLNFFENIKNLAKLNFYSEEIRHNIVKELDLIDTSKGSLAVFDEMVESLNNSVEDYVDQFSTKTNLNYKKLKQRLQQINKIADPENPHNDSMFNNFSFQTFVVQNLNSGSVKKRLNEFELTENYRFIHDFKAFDFKNNEEEIKKFIEKTASGFITETMVLNIDDKISKSFASLKNKVILSVQEVKDLDPSIRQYDDQKIDSLLNSLHGILSCFYFKVNYDLKEKLKNFKLDNIVIIDIEKFTEWIYEILNQTQFLKINEGYFSKDEALEWLKEDVARVYIDYLLAFMIQNKLIFKIKDQEHFFSPNYLKDKQSRTEKIFLKCFQKPIVKYIFNEYFHTSILSEIINNYFDKLILENEDDNWKFVLWKNKLIFYEDDSEKLIFISFIIEDKSSQISISRYNYSVSDEFIIQVCSFIESVIKSYDYEKLVSNKKGSYLPFDILNNINKTEDSQNTNFIIYQNILYKRSDFKMFLNDKENYPMKKVCISYSKEDLPLVNKFKDYLVPLSDDGLIEDPWYCTDLVAGDAWDEEIKNKFDEADIIFFMVSENLMKTKYVKEVEIKNAVDRWEKDRKSIKIIPIVLEYYHWTREGVYNLGRFTALPYTIKPVLDFKRQNMAWYIIIEAIKVMIKKDLGDDQATVGKEVKAIYERIVKGEVNDAS